MRLCSEILAAHLGFRFAGTSAEVHSGLAQMGSVAEAIIWCQYLSLYVRLAGALMARDGEIASKLVGLTEYHNPCRMCCHAYALTRILEGLSLSAKIASASSHQVDSIKKKGAQEPAVVK
jgi:hypothetical protein